MARPKCLRQIYQKPLFKAFMPGESQNPKQAPLQLTLDEWEAIRLSDLEHLYQTQAASVMSVSRQTYARILGSARHKLAQAVVNGRKILIEGGAFHFCKGRKPCHLCRSKIEQSSREGHPEQCPGCRRYLKKRSFDNESMLSSDLEQRPEQ